MVEDLQKNNTSCNTIVVLVGPEKIPHELPKISKGAQIILVDNPLNPQFQIPVYDGSPGSQLSTGFPIDITFVKEEQKQRFTNLPKRFN